MTNKIDESIYKEFIELVDHAIALTKHEIDRYRDTKVSENLIQAAEVTLEGLEDTKKGVQSGLLIPSEGALLGFTREMGEWSDNQELKDLGYRIDKLYSEKM